MGHLPQVTGLNGGRRTRGSSQLERARQGKWFDTDDR